MTGTVGEVVSRGWRTDFETTCRFSVWSPGDGARQAYLHDPSDCFCFLSSSHTFENVHTVALKIMHQENFE